MNLEEISGQLDALELDIKNSVLEEATINQQIADLRYRLSEITTQKRTLRDKKYRLEKDKESIERKKQLEQEQKVIEEDYLKLRAIVEKRIQDAPWLDKAFDWQIDGSLKLAVAERGLLADVRGMGKTFSSIIWREAVGSKRTLFLTRNQYAKETMREVNYWASHIPVIPIIAAPPIRRKFLIQTLRNHDEYIVVANHEMWRKSDDAIKDLLQGRFDGIIFDEAHLLKNFGSVTTKGFLQLAPTVEMLLHMTGTPVQNRPQELFAILHTLYPHLFPSEAKFTNDYCYQIEQNRWTWQPGGLNALTKKMSHFFVARTPKDVGHKIPPPAVHEYELTFEGYEEQAAAYKLMADRALAELKSGRTLPILYQIALMTRQAQLTSWPAGIIFKIRNEEGDIVGTESFDVHQSVKMDFYENLIKDLVEEEQRIVLFSRFKSAIWEMDRRLKAANISAAVITGEVKKTEHIIQDFDLKTAPENPKYSVLLATYDTVGESVNLNAARHLIQFDRYWKPSRDEQAIGRIDRINSMDQATVHRAYVADTVDKFMIDLIEEKKDMITNFKSASEMQGRLIDHLEKSVNG